eukprot:gnl/MRDRNA2_/MRDRNA2_94955_c0_seq1.p1 gnl/MRDRNA2_/MRDRNA2_94955_c0~~gnl/MRDRNA2_/MRDRNA2_94955_c0_seq1.p1  ORF type:complete len:467 (-),score=84.28 gnl/MRDRNA2_/MRDRNA2_94955_c0_seq1:38-1438(-)
MGDETGAPEMSEEQAATKVQSLFRGKQARQEVEAMRGAQADAYGADEDYGHYEGGQSLGEDDLDDGEGIQPYFQDFQLLKAYQGACESSGRPVNGLVERSLLESGEANGKTYFIEAPGNSPLTFSSRLNDVDMGTFASVFGPTVRFLSRLDLSYNFIGDDGAISLVGSILVSEASKLCSVILKGNSIGPKGCDALCRGLRDCRGLRRLDLSNNPLKKIGGLAIAEFLQNNLTLQEVYLSDSEIDIDALVAIAAVLHVNNQTLKVCGVENPRVGTLQEEHTVHFGRMLRVNTGLSEIYLGKHKIRDDGVKHLVSFLVENKTLRVLDLRCNEIGAEGAKSLGYLLKTDCQLMQLNLSGNRIGEKNNTSGAQAIAEALLSNRMLSHLDLNHNMLCGEALQLLAMAVDENSTLESIGLFDNQWDQSASYKFHQIFHDRARVFPIQADFITNEVDLRIHICKVQDWKPVQR